MISERETLDRQLESAINRYAIATGAIELLYIILDHPRAQVALSHALSNGTMSEEWKTYGRFVGSGASAHTWWGPVPVEELKPYLNTLISDQVGKILTELIGSVDYYLTTVLKKRYNLASYSGSSWEVFEAKTGISLLDLKNGAFVYQALQERHKVEHNKSVIDKKFLDKLAKKQIGHSYALDSKVERGHYDVTRSYEAFREFADDVESKLREL